MTGKSDLLLRPRREIFDHGLLPLPLPLPQTLGPLLKNFSSIEPHALAGELNLPLDHAGLVLHVISSLLPSDRQIDGYDVLLFLYLQSYKRLVPRGAHKDSAAVADVWPSMSAFDGCLSALSPLQLVRTNTRRFMPSQADEETHQLSYLQKHMAEILALLAESVEGKGEESLVLTLERLVHLEFLIQFEDNKDQEGISLSQAAPFFANSDPDMPAVPVPITQVRDWILESIAASLEHTSEKVEAKENGPLGASDLDVNMTDACVNQTKVQNSSSPSGISLHSNPLYSRSQTFVEGICKTSVVKHACDIKGHSVKVLNCHESTIYILAPLKYAIVYGCSDATVVLGAIGKAVRVEHCERLQVITAAKRICIANCRECVFFLGVNQQPLIFGDNHQIQVAPYNTYYSQLVDHMAQVGVDPTVNRWNEPLALGMVDPHDSLSHPAGVSDEQAESAMCLDADLFTNFQIPTWFVAESADSTKENPFQLPEIYLGSLKKKHSTLVETQQALRDLQVDENCKQDIASALHAHFKEWLYASGNIRHLYCLQGD